MKKLVYIILLLTCATSINTLHAKEDAVLLSSKLLAFADGLMCGVTGNHIGFTLQLREELYKMLKGKKNVEGKHIGIFKLKNSSYSIKELHELEKQGTLSGTEHKQVIYDVVEHFVEKILPFSVHAQGMQELLNSLIADSCAKRNRPNSFLLTWSECPQGSEAKLLHKEMTSFAKLDEFITDLTNYLTDFVHSCPKARAQFIALLKEKQSHN